MGDKRAPQNPERTRRGPTNNPNGPEQAQRDTNVTTTTKLSSYLRAADYKHVITIFSRPLLDALRTLERTYAFAMTSRRHYMVRQVILRFRILHVRARRGRTSGGRCCL